MPHEALSILYSDEHLLVVDKPAGLLSMPGGAGEGPSLPELLTREGHSVVAVHRLDREVSGCILFARTAQVRERLEEIFKAHTITKTYWALASGQVRPPSGAIKFPILEEGPNVRISAAGKKSETRYRTLATHPTTSELEVDLVTGRRNQVRLHFAHLGFPLVGERKFARGKDATIHFRSRRVALHAWRLALAHPVLGTRLEVEAPLPADLLDLRQRAAEGRGPPDRHPRPPRGRK